MKKSRKAPISYLERGLRMTDTDRGAIIRASPVWRARDELLRSGGGASCKVDP